MSRVDLRNVTMRHVALAALLILGVYAAATAFLGRGGTPQAGSSPSPTSAASTTSATPTTTPAASTTTTTPVIPADTGEEGQRATLDAVLPAFATYRTGERSATGKWMQSMPVTVTTEKWRAQCRRDLTGLWGTAMRQNLSVTGARITRADRLWDLGDTSAWRVTLARTLTPLSGSTGLGGKDTAVFDVLLTSSDGTVRADAFAAPTKATTKPGSFPRGTEPTR